MREDSMSITTHMQAPQAPNTNAQAQLRADLLTNWDKAEISPEARKLAGQRVLLSGTSGQLGLWILRILLKAGAEVEALGFRTPLELAHKQLRFHIADLTRPSALDAMRAQGTMPETLIFCAPLWFLTPQLPALTAGGVRRIVAFSSTSMHAKATSAHTSEKALVTRLQEGEAAIHAWEKETGGKATILRPTMIYGVGLDRNVVAVARMLRKLHFFPIAMNAHGLRQPAHLADLADAVFRVLAEPRTAGKAYDLSGGEVLPYDQFVARIAALPDVGGRPCRVPLLAPMLDIAGYLLGKRDSLHGEIARRMGQDLAFSHDAAGEDFGYAPRRFLDAARQPEGLAFLA